MLIKENKLIHESKGELSVRSPLSTKVICTYKRKREKKKKTKKHTKISRNTISCKRQRLKKETQALRVPFISFLILFPFTKYFPHVIVKSS